jgi:hypothetical protein
LHDRCDPRGRLRRNVRSLEVGDHRLVPIGDGVGLRNTGCGQHGKRHDCNHKLPLHEASPLPRRRRNDCSRRDRDCLGQKVNLTKRRRPSARSRGSSRTRVRPAADGAR